MSEAAKKHLASIIEQGGNVVKSYDDGAFDVKDFFNFLEQNGIESAIRNRSNASTKARGSMRRKKEVIKFKKLGYKKWAKEKDYGMRWPMTEGHFSGIKRGYGDCANAKKIENRVTKLRFGVPIACKKFGLKHNNNSVERHNRELSRRFDALNVFQTHIGAESTSALCKMAYNYVNSHTMLDSKTPAEAAELILYLGENKMLSLIQLAKKIEMTTS